ncbi:uncharacterized protein V2V93DRAFT_361951 [Kockiozyma suomiensis]|uniref:uncharacterized protein n=1 Tax=Kockiozyma suomiensis TaxID=1337062 RepID=UPI003344258F
MSRDSQAVRSNRLEVLLQLLIFFFLFTPEIVRCKSTSDLLNLVDNVFFFANLLCFIQFPKRMLVLVKQESFANGVMYGCLKYSEIGKQVRFALEEVQCILW